MPRIHILDQHAANQIAAGEVVERPASVIKELVENALDAGAKHIDISVVENGVPFMRIRDDGEGIAPDDLPLAVLRHATSKIKRIEDLDRLQTLGFRGEALPSIASVSRLEIVSRSQDQITGMCLTLEGGERMELKEVGCPVGTTITVRDLFFNTPARRKFLRSTNTEFGMISDVVTRLSLARPDVAFSLAHPKHIVFKSSGNGRFLEAIGAVLGSSIARKLIPLSLAHANVTLSGYISPPDLVRSSKQAQTFIVNGRIIRSTVLSRALQEGYHTLIPGKFYPIAVLYLKLPPSEYDVNVHPTKMDIRFKHEKELCEFIAQGVRDTLLKRDLVPGSGSSLGSTYPVDIAAKTSVNTIKEKAESLALGEQKTSEETCFQALLAPRSNEQEPPLLKIPVAANEDKVCMKIPNQLPESAQATVRKRVEHSLSALTAVLSDTLNNTLPKRSLGVLTDALTDTLESQEGFDLQIGKENYETEIENSQVENFENGNWPSEGTLANIWPLAQIFNTYILATNGNELIVIDQHAAHERVNYERLLEEAKQQKMASQALLVPITMEFTPQEEQTVLEHLWALSEMGFVLEQFGSRTYLLRGVPAQTGNIEADVMLRQFIEQVLLKHKAPTYDKLLEEWIYLLACKASIKARESMSLLEMEQLIAQLGHTRNPYTCPHGRPTMIKISRHELEKRFYRI